MARLSNRAKILAEGMRVVLAHGFGGASVRDIVHAAGVPQGSFSNHFTSKEAFGLELLEIYHANTQDLLNATVLDDALPPLKGLRDFIDANKARLRRDGMQNGCLSGNFSAEASEHSEVIRLQLVCNFADIRDAIAHNLRRALREGQLPPNATCDTLAEFIIGGLQGAILLAKVQHSLRPVEQFEQVLFDMILMRPDHQSISMDGGRTAL
jgi:TetR/AcrR family transcriptional repressor of nem operon